MAEIENEGNRQESATGSEGGGVQLAQSQENTQTHLSVSAVE